MPAGARRNRPGDPGSRAIVLGMTDDAVAVRVVEWNVSMALQRKTHLLAKLAPTIAILPETAHRDRTRAALEAIGATMSSTSVQWVGANKNKGLSVVAFDGWDLRIDDSYDEGYQWVLPVHVIGPHRVGSGCWRSGTWATGARVTSPPGN